MKTYTVYLKSGNIVVVSGNYSLRTDDVTEIYGKNKNDLVARFENSNIEGLVIKEFKEVEK